MTMTNAVRKIAQVIKDNYEITRGAEVTNRDQIARAVITALPDIIDPLIWDYSCAKVFDDGSGEIICKAASKCDVYRYSIFREPGVGFTAFGYVDLPAGPFETVEEAVGSIETHFRRRIMAYFGLTPSEVEKWKNHA